MNKGIELTLPSAEEIWGNDKLSVLKKYGTRAAITDLCILTGSVLCDETIDEDNSLTGRISSYWTRSDDGDNDVRTVAEYGLGRNVFRDNRRAAIRPVLLLPPDIFKEITKNRTKGYNDTEEVLFGEYPQYAPGRSTQKKLKWKYQNNELTKTGRSYTFNSVKMTDYSTVFTPVTYEEYEYQGKKYIRVKANSIYDGYEFKLSNGIEYNDDDYVWLEVSPVSWLIDDETYSLISKKGLVSGIRFNEECYDGDFSKTEMKSYLDNYMLRDLFQSETILNKESLSSQKELSEIEKLINFISEYIKDIPNKQLIIDEVNQLIEEYNQKLNKINNSKEILVFDTVDTIKKSIKAKLMLILDRVKTYCEINKVYLELIDYIDNAILSLNGQSSKNIDDSLLNDLAEIGNICLNYLADDNLKDKFIRIFQEEQNKIKDYLTNILTKEMTTDKPKYDSKESFELYIRERLHPLLIELSNNVNRKDLLTEIKTKTVEIMIGVYKKSDNRRISLYLEEINSTYNKIATLVSSSNINPDCLKEAERIIAKNLDYLEKATDICNELRNMLLALYGILFDIEEALKNKQGIENSYIKTRL